MSAIVYGSTIVLELWLNFIFLPLLVLLTSPVWIPVTILAQITISVWMTIFTKTPLIDKTFVVLRWLLYELPYWPRKFVWKLIYTCQTL